MSERTASKIRAYCEAASDGPWAVSPGGGVDAPKDVMDELYRTGNFEANQHFSANARTDLPRALEAAVIERSVLRVLIEKAQAMSDLVSYEKRPITRLDIMALDDALMGASAVWDETAWLADSPEAEGGET